MCGKFRTNISIFSMYKNILLFTIICKYTTCHGVFLYIKRKIEDFYIGYICP